MMKSINLHETQSDYSFGRLMQPVSSWKKPLASFRQELSIVDSIAAQGAVNHNAPAVCAKDATLTYGELESESNRLARRLLEIGAERETVVGIYLERSPAVAVGALGILKAGAAYLPLDPSYPPERISLILNDARVSIVVSTTELIPRLPVANGNVLDLADPQGLLARCSPDPLPIKVSPEQLAYVIYTSGSTGRPKGVEIEHSNLLNLIHWHIDTFNVSRLDCATLLASPGFDASVWELWPYLYVGASLYIPDETTRLSPLSLRDWMVSQGITISFVPTPLAEKLMLLEWSADAPLRTLLTGADVLHQTPQPGLPFKLVNNYGPTECTVVATSGIVHSSDSLGGLPSIGKAISNTQTYILDENLKQATSGELYIGGAGVGRGYLRDPELTAKKFIPNPFSNDPRSRLFKTGDSVRGLPDGRLEFLGRTDEQVKIRGFRVEPNEISMALCSHAAVESAVVIARKDDSDNNYLAAYLILKKDRQVKVAELRSHLQAHLPDYMVPLNFIVLDSFPLTANGKVDRNALPAPTPTNVLHDSEQPLSRGPVNEKLVELVSKLLGVENVAPHENFFLLGGHSLMGAQLIAQIREVFGVDLALRTLFENPTVAAISSQLDRGLESSHFKSREAKPWGAV